jgi:hypothetical protein
MLGLEDALGAVLAEDLYAAVSVPPFDGAQGVLETEHPGRQWCDEGEHPFDVLGDAAHLRLHGPTLGQ